MASQKHISCLSFVIVLAFYCVSCYSFSYHEDVVHDYMSPLSRVYTCCIRKALRYMFQDPGFSSSLLALPFDVDSFGAKGDGKKDDTNVCTHTYVFQLVCKIDVLRFLTRKI
ncbi:hypothetical protein Hdeb2414_s0020g00558351 [Helianthus debilis subsp. tardiflorus]